MLAPTKLERLLLTERHRRQADESSLAGFAHPMIFERALDAGLEPLAVSNARGDLVATKVSRARGIARYGFFECLREDEGPLVPRFYECLWKLSEDGGWDNRCTSLPEALSKMKLQPRSIVVSPGFVPRLGLEQAELDVLSGPQGYLSKGDQQILVADLPEGQALVTSAAALLGFYTRIDDQLGVLLTRVDQTAFLIRGGSA